MSTIYSNTVVSATLTEENGNFVCTAKNMWRRKNEVETPLSAEGASKDDAVEGLAKLIYSFGISGLMQVTDEQGASVYKGVGEGPHLIEMGDDMDIPFIGSEDDMAYINKIAKRARQEAMMLGRYELTADQVRNDLRAVHFGGMPLRLQEMVDAPMEDLMHDIWGINKHLDHNTLKLVDFNPRYRR